MGKNNKARRKLKQARKAAQEKRQRQNSNDRAKDQTLAPKLHMIPNPFEGMTDEQHRLAIGELSKHYEEQYQEALSYLRRILRQHSPLDVLSIMSFYGLSVGVNETTGLTKLDSESDISQFHVEILQALSLQIEPEDLPIERYKPDVVAEVREKVQTLCFAQQFRRLDPSRMELPDDEKTVGLVQLLMRGASQALRNWGYHSQVKRIARELYSPFDARLFEVRGFTTSDVFDVFEAVVQEAESRQTVRRQTVASLIASSGTSRRLLVENYHELIGLEKEAADEFTEQFNVEEVPLEAVQSFVLSHYDLRLHGVYTFFASHLADIVDLDEERVSAILDEYSLLWGELNKYPTEQLHLSNPVCRKPVIKLGVGEYFCALPACFFSFVIPCIEEVLSPFGAAVSNRRAEYLESKVAEIVKRRFPDSSVKRNHKWVEGDASYETDLIAFIDSFALIIECKSGRITPPALRGAPDRVRRHVEELLIDPNLQSLRLKKRIELLSSKPNASDPMCEEIGYDLSRVRRVVRVSVCLEDFAVIHSSVKQLEDTGWLPANFQPCPTMNLADLETVFDILEHPVQILHYLMKREVVEASVGLLADELELLGLYLATLLDVGDVAHEIQLTTHGMSAPLENYYSSFDAGVPLEKPRPAISPLFESIITQLEQRDIERWTEIGVALNMFSPDDQRKIANKLSKLEKLVHKHWRKQGHMNMLICTPKSKGSHCALGYVMYKNGNAEERRNFMDIAADSALESRHIEKVIVIAKNIDHDDVAYNAIAQFVASADPPT